MVILVLPWLGRDCNVDAGRCILDLAADAVDNSCDNIGFVDLGNAVCVTSCRTLGAKAERGRDGYQRDVDGWLRLPRFWASEGGRGKPPCG